MGIFEQIMELGPVVRKLLPLLERVLTGTNFSAALSPSTPPVDLSGVRGDIEQVSKAHGSLLRQMQDQTMQIAGVEEEVKRLRMALEHSERRVESVERELSSLSMLTKIVGGVTVFLLIVLMVILLLHR